jgi:hypothetical protein
MRKALTKHLFAALSGALVSGTLCAQDADRIVQANEQPKADSALAVISYKAPLRGAPATRVGGGTRSVAMKPVALSALAPNETGYTTRDKPTIYWYVSQPLSYPVELTLISTESLEAASTPALEFKLAPPVTPGVHAISLESLAVTLKPGVEYQWFVAVVGNSEQRSNDVIAGGTIKRVAESDAVRAKLKEAPAEQRAALYAGEGLWYDAVDELSRQISAQPQNRALRESRASLLEQVGLTEVAASDRAALR